MHSCGISIFGFESLRRSADLVSKSIHKWVGERLQSHRDRGTPWVEARLQFLLDLGVNLVTAELLASQLQLVWTYGALWFLQGAFYAGDHWEAVASAVMDVWRLHGFSESRWLTVGTSCRAYTASLLFGLDDFVRMLKANKDNSLFYLNGVRPVE